MVEFQQIKGTSKKTGKEFTGYVFKVGEFSSPMFFPSKVELEYINDHLND